MALKIYDAVWPIIDEISLRDVSIGVNRYKFGHIVKLDYGLFQISNSQSTKKI